jgi:GNAT superfamily N-acetyltransferase
MRKVIRELAPAEVTELYLPLRLTVMHEKLGWTTHAVSTPNDLRDRFDSTAIQLGCFVETEFAGALRIVVAASTSDLPSGPFMPAVEDAHGKVAELTKGFVYPRFRGFGVFRDLAETSIRRAHASGAVHLFLSTFETGRERAFWARYGFEPRGEMFQFSDEHISPREKVRLFYQRSDL